MKHTFKYMLKEYGIPYLLKEKPLEKDMYVNGDLVEWIVEPVQRRGIIFTISRQELQYGLNGTYTTQDIKLFDSIDIPMKSIVIWKGIEYVVDEKDPWDDYSDFHLYLCKKREKRATV